MFDFPVWLLDKKTCTLNKKHKNTLRALLTDASLFVTLIKDNWRYYWGDCVMFPHPKLFVPLKQNGNPLRMEWNWVAIVTTPTCLNVWKIHLSTLSCGMIKVVARGRMDFWSLRVLKELFKWKLHVSIWFITKNLCFTNNHQKYNS